jgi:hypothetical protein
MREQWRTIPEFAGWYEASNLGRIRRIKPAAGATVGKVICFCRNKVGYINSHLSIQHKVHVRLTHRLVASAFIGPCPPGKEVNHKDGNKSNNNIDNLEYVTSSENHRHAINIGLQRSVNGDRHGMAKLSYEDVLKVIFLLKSGKTQREIANMFGIGQPSVSNINIGKTWSKTISERGN